MIKRPYRYSPEEIKDLKDIDTVTALMIEAYALACTDIMYAMTKDSPCAKSYDPMRIEGMTAHSYAFDLKDGGRHHDLTEYESVGEILEYLVKETLEWVESAAEHLVKN
jgi:hypothetical protein